MGKSQEILQGKEKKEKPHSGFSFLFFCRVVYFSAFLVMVKRFFAKNLQARNPKNSISIAPK